MESIIPGYHYDIFISYRQKDNKYDGWVTEFVDNLKRELESAFKEDIRVYFDINPHDGLLETHDVDASLKEKLKCLIFIPILSRTYCDPKSFAWVNEFMAFVKQATDDHYGLKVKLPNGNIASRVLPVTIHDLDNEDTRLCESVLGGFLRGIEFIYKEPGVNRPLTPEDDPKTNINKTRYRNQINKIALAIKEIIAAIKKPDQSGEKTVKVGKAASVEESVAEYEKSIAVLPFINDSPDQENTYFINGVMEEILNNLQRIKGLRVISRTSVEQYRGQSKPISEIAEELGVNYIVEGSGQRYGNSFRLRTQLIMAAKETHLWGESFQKNINSVEDIFGIQIQIAEAIATELKTVITPQEKQLIEKTPTEKLEAYDDYLKGQFYWRKLTPQDVETSLRYFELALEKDPDFALAYAGIANVWLGRQQMGFTPPEEAGPLAYEAAMKAVELDSTCAEVHYSLGLMYIWGMFDWAAGENSLRKAIDLKPAFPEAHIYYSHLLNILSQPEKAREHADIAIKQDPANPLVIVLYAVDHLFFHEYEKARELAYEVLRMDPTSGLASFVIAFSSFHLGQYSEMTEGFIKQFSFQYNGVIESLSLSTAEQDYKNTLELLAESAINNRTSIYVLPTDIAQIFSLLCDKERMIEWIEKGIEEHDPGLPYIKLLFECFGEDSRFDEIAGKMNLPSK